MNAMAVGESDFSLFFCLFHSVILPKKWGARRLFGALHVRACGRRAAGTLPDANGAAWWPPSASRSNPMRVRVEKCDAAAERATAGSMRHANPPHVAGSSEGTEPPQADP